MSHTVRLIVKLKNREAILAAASECGATVLGEGTHRSYSGAVSGLGVQLKGWRYPVVIDKEGTVSYDNFGGQWGAQAELNKLTETYALAAAEKEVENLGWYYEKAPGILKVFHPSGGEIVIEANGRIDASGFTGGACAEATKQIEQALGIELERDIKTEYNQSVVEQTQVE